AFRRALRARLGRGERAPSDAERAQPIPRDLDLEGRRNPVKQPLSRALLEPGYRFPDGTLVRPLPPMTERVLQFGEGNFLRAFVDWMIHRMNQRGLFGGRAVLVQPIAKGMAEALNAQQGLYTVILRGIEDASLWESREIVESVSRCIDP